MATFAQDWRVANHGTGVLAEADAGSETARSGWRGGGLFDAGFALAKGKRLGPAELLARVLEAAEFTLAGALVSFVGHLNVVLRVAPAAVLVEEGAVTSF